MINVYKLMSSHPYMEENDYDAESDWIDSGAEYSPKSEFSKAKICEDATRRCIELRAKEMRKGYYNTTFSKDGLPLKTWIEDSRKGYCSSVIALRQLMSPELAKDIPKKKKGKPQSKEVIFKDVDLNAVFEKYAYKFLEPIQIDGKTNYKSTDKLYMPDMDEAVQIRKIFPDGNEELISMPGYWNSKVNAYWDEMVRSCDKLFTKLMDVLDRLNYFKPGIRYG